MRSRHLGLLAVACLLLGAIPARAELTLKKVWPAKSFCQTGETNTFDIEVANPDAAAGSARLKVELVRELDTAVILREEAITVEPGKSLTRSLSWKAEPWLGAEVRATLSRDGKALESKSEYFTCADNVHQVLISGTLPLILGGFDKTLNATVDSVVKNTRSLYANWAEQFAWAPSDFDLLAPAEDRWWSGQTSYNIAKFNMLMLYGALRANGLRCITYTKAGGGNLPTFDYLRKHPEHAVYGGGRPGGGMYDAAYLDYLQTIGPPKAGETRNVAMLPAEMEKAGYAGAGQFAPFVKELCTWNDVWYDGVNDEVIRTMSRQMGESAKMLGFAGCRFDGEFAASRFQRFDGAYNSPPDLDVDVADQRLVRNMKQWTWALAPGYLFGYNTHVDIRWDVKSGGVPPAFREKCADDGLIVQEEMAFPGGMPWTEFIRTIKHHSEMVRHYGGHYATIPFMRDPGVLYCYIIPYALNAHSHFYCGSKQPMGKFTARFAPFLWDSALHGWSGAGEQFSVNPTWKAEVTALDADHDIWWKPFAAVRPAPGGGTNIILHLINAPRTAHTPTTGPAKPELREKYLNDMLPAAPAETVEVRWKKPAGFRRAMVADLDRNDLQPVAARTEGNELVFTVPQVAHWSMLIIETSMPTPPVEEITAGTNTAKLPTAQELGLAPAASDNSSWQTVMVAGDYGWGNGVSDLAPDPQAKSGSAVHAKPGNRAWYMAVGTYVYPPIPGKYAATFRLKIADNTVEKPVLSLGIEDNRQRLPGVAPLANQTLTIKGTDFAKPNVYQDFTITFEHPDIGFNGIICNYHGNAEVWWDVTEVKLLQRWIPEDFEKHYAGFVPPADLAKAPHDGLNVLVIRGPWNRLYAVDAALAKVGKPVTATNAYIRYNAQAGTSVVGFPVDWKPLYEQDVLVLANAEVGTLPYGQGKILRKWVQDGGSLVILGGMYTLGQAGIMQYGWPVALPVNLNIPFEIRKCAAPVAFTAPGKALGVTTKWKTPPVVLYRHLVTPKAGASVLMTGNRGEPLLVGGPYGKGRVVVFTGTVLGEPPAGQTPFWQSPDWPNILAGAIRWARSKQVNK